MFTQDQIASAVTDAMKVATGIPPGHKGAFLTLADQDGVKAVIAHKLDDHWVVTAAIDHPWSGGIEYGTTIGATW